jgi:tetratricopeptide (TPR) repeat protein
MSTIASLSSSSSPSSTTPLGTAASPSIANIARAALDSFVPATPPFLVGEQEDLTVKMLETGQRFLRLGNLEEARTAFEATLEQDDLDEVLTAECYLGMALTFPVNSDERSDYIKEAEVEIDTFYETRSDWSRDEEKVFYRNCLTIYQKLVVVSKIEAKEGLTLKIENCEKRLFKTPQQKSSEADALYKNKQNDEARVLYREVLRDLENEEGCLEWNCPYAS